MKRLFFVAALAVASVIAAASCSDNNPPECVQLDAECVPALADGGGGSGGGSVQCGTQTCSGGAPVCNSATTECVVCTPAEGCSGLAHICDTASEDGGVCIECVQNTDCPADAPFCEPTTALCFSSDGGRPLLPDGGTAGGGGGGSGGGAGGGTGGGAGGGTGGGAGGGAGGGTGGGTGTDGGTDAGVPLDGGSGPGDNCNSAIPVLFLDGGTSVTFSIDTRGARNDFNGAFGTACRRLGNNNGNDLVYALTLTATRNVAVTAAPTGTQPPNVALYVNNSPCPGGSQRACSNDLANASAAETVNMTAVPAGTYYIVFDTTTATPGTADVVISVTP